MRARQDNTIDSWRGLDPGSAAKRIFEAVETLGDVQRRAVVAHMETRDNLERSLHEAGDGPLSGIPTFLKDLYPINGYVMRAGSKFLPEERPVSGAGVLATQISRLGGVVAGAVQLHEFAYGLTGENPHYGAVVHPVHPDRTSGGSSSGSAAAVARGLAPIAFGTDTAGSIRLPAAYCGLHGVRLAPGHPWLADAFPLAPSFDTPGWFTVDARSMAETLQILAPSKPPVADARIAWVEIGDVELRCLEAQRTLAQKLGAAEASRDLASDVSRVWREAPSAFRKLRSPEAWRVHAAWWERRQDDYDRVVRDRIAEGRAVTHDEEAEGRVWLRQAAAEAASWFDRWDALVLPGSPGVAPLRSNLGGAERERAILLMAGASVLGLSSLAVPFLFTDGLSTGIQVVAPADRMGVFVQLLNRLQESGRNS